MSFLDLLNKPLEVIRESCSTEGCGTEACGNESCKEEACKKEGCDTEACGNEACKSEACKREGCKMEGDDEDDDDYEDDEDDDRDDIDAAMDEMDIEDELQGMSDDEIDDLANSLLSSEIDDLSGDDDPVDLTPDEERDADDMMAVAATMGVIQNELNAQEKATLIESAADLRIAVDEGFLMESDLRLLEESVEPVMEAAFAPKTKVKFSLKDREKQLYAIAINSCARSHNDPDYYGLQKLNRLRRIKRAKLEKKYHAEAVQRMKVYIKRLKSSKSSILSGIGKKLSR